MKGKVFWVSLLSVLAAGMALTSVVENEYYYNALYLILQGTLMAVAWNVLGGLTGYVNFGSAGFFAMGAYTTVALNKAFALPLPLIILAAGAVGGLVGLGLGYLTLRLKGVYFAIATLAMAIVIETLVNNWSYVGGAKGSYMLTPESHLWFDSYIQMLFVVMLLLTLAAVAVSRTLSASRLGRGLAAIRDDEVAA
ncbi:MAG: branched-chain amino acid ABC transporter permease, partial [Burkholderiales bacterium]